MRNRIEEGIIVGSTSGGLEDDTSKNHKVIQEVSTSRIFTLDDLPNI